MTVNSWVADDGYTFSSTKHLSVVWTPGLRHSRNPNIQSFRDEGVWEADPGYIFPDPATIDTTWYSGVIHPKWPRIYSAQRTRTWVTYPGFTFATTKTTLVSESAGDLSVEWVPNVQHPYCPYLVSAPRAEFWRTVEGYRLVSSDRFDVVRILPSENSNRFRDFAVSLAVAVVAHSFSVPEPGDGKLGAVGRHVAGKIRDKAAESAVDALVRKDPTALPNLPMRCDYFGLGNRTPRIY